MKVSKHTCFFLFSAFATVFLFLDRAYSQATVVGVNRVVIDAGHGGKDPGATYKTYYEKDINLAVALRLGELIRDHYPKVEVIYTRKTDVFIPLIERGNIANKAGANLFISIHVNANPSSAVSGIETYVMGVDKAGKNLDVAMKENDVIVYEDNYTTTYQGYVPGSSESFIIFSLMQYSYQNQSLNFANMLQKEYAQRTDLKQRGVKQAGFLVLWNAAMPSILTELGFLSNESDREVLISKEGQEKYASCIFNAFSEYKTKSEGSGTPVTLSGNTSVNRTATSSDAKTVSTTPIQTTTASKPASGALIYSVQVMSSDKKVPQNSTQFGRYKGEVKERLISNRYKYFVGSVSTYKEALSLQDEVRKEIKDAFVVPFLNDQPITISEARKLE